MCHSMLWRCRRHHAEGDHVDAKFLLAFLLASLISLPAQAPPKVKVLILIGFITYHDWRAATPIPRHILESTGKFEVHVNEGPRKHARTFAPYDLLLWNY